MMKKMRALIFIFFVMFLSLSVMPGQAIGNNNVFRFEHHPTHLIVTLNGDSSLLSNSSFMASAGVRHKTRLAIAIKPGSNSFAHKESVHLVELSGQISLKNARAILLQHPDIAMIEPDYILRAINTPNDPNFSSLYGMGLIQAESAWDVTTGNPNVVVGVIDSGVDNTHPDLSANIWSNPGEIPGNGIDDDGNGFIDDTWGWDFVNNDNDPWDDLYHGTHVAGTIGAEGNNGIGVTGVSWQVSIASLKFLDQNGSGFTSNAINAIAYANAMGFPITNNSWGGGGFSQALKQVIESGISQGFLFVASSGNDGRDTDGFPSYPASYDSSNILSIAATDSSDDLASFSNFGATSVDLGAPGVSILSAFPNNDYAFLSGTSMAAPHVSGASALLVGVLLNSGAVQPADFASTVKQAIMNSVDPINTLNGVTVSGGRLNVNDALSALVAPTNLISVNPANAALTLLPGETKNLVITVTNLTNRQQRVNIHNWWGWHVAGLLDLSQNSLDLAPSASADLTLTFYENSAPAGDHTLNLLFETDEPGPSETSSITVTITGP